MLPVSLEEILNVSLLKSPSVPSQIIWIYTYAIIQKQAIFIELNLQFLSNGLTPLVKTKDAVDKPNCRTLMTKNSTMLLIFHEAPR